MSRNSMNSPRAPVGQGSHGKVAERLLDHLDLLHVVSAGSLSERQEVVARLITLHDREQHALDRDMLCGNGLVIAGDKLGRARLPGQPRPAFPGVPVSDGSPVGEPLRPAINALEAHAHRKPPSIGRSRSIGLIARPAPRRRRSSRPEPLQHDRHLARQRGRPSQPV